MTFNLTAFFNSGLRGLISLSKFVLTLVIASKFDLSILGEYSLVVNAVLITIFIIGFEVYQYTSRSIIIEPKDQFQYIQKHFIYVVTAFLYISPLFYLFFHFGVLKTDYLIPLYILLFFELVSNEQYRLLIALKHPIFANLVLFIRTSIWIYLFLILLKLKFSLADPLLVIIKFWSIGAFISILIPLVYFIKIYKGSFGKIKDLPSFSLIVNYWKKCYVLFFASLVLMLINIVDKFVVDFYCEKTVLGVYSLYFSLTSMVFTFVLAGVISVTYPHLVESYQLGKSRYKREFRQFSKRLLISSLLMGLLSVIIFKAYLYFNAQEVEKLRLIYENMNAYVLLLISFIIYTLHMKFHYELYATKNDAAIMKANYVTFIIYLCILIPLTNAFAILGAAGAHLVASSSIFILKKRFAIKYDRIGGLE